MGRRAGFEYVNYEIYQMELSEATHGKVFWDLPEGKDYVDFKEDPYKRVYDDGLYILNTGDDVVLEKLYEVFNINHPKDFRGRSLSVSDIVRVGRNFYCCQGIGWKEVKVLNLPDEYI